MTTAEKIKEEVKEIKIETKHCIQCNSDMREFKKYCIPHESELKICQARLTQYKSDLQQELEFIQLIRGRINVIKEHRGFKDGELDKTIFYLTERINLIKKELEDIEI
jgi:hypothetical protein